VPPPFAHSSESETGPWFFCLRHAVHAGAIGIVMVGELDIAAADEARYVIARAQGEAAEVICDLHDVSFIDPCGLHVLLDAAASARRHEARVTLVNPSACVRRLIGRLGLQAVLQADPVPSPARPTRPSTLSGPFVPARRSRQPPGASTPRARARRATTRRP
jgi:anti-anti-sigma factor